MISRTAIFAIALALLSTQFVTAQEVIIQSFRAETEDGNGEIRTVESFSLAPTAAPVLMSAGGMGAAFVGGDPLNMLQMQQYIDELAILDDQKADLRKLRDEVRKIRTDVFKNAKRTNGRPDYRTLAPKIREAQELAQEKMEVGLKKILIPAQYERLEEIRTQRDLQNQGLSAVAGSRLANLLGLTDEQRKQLAEKQGEYQKRLMQEIEKLKAQLQKEVLEDVLSPEQVTKLEKLQGDKFDVKRQTLRDRLETLRKEAANKPSPKVESK